MKMDLWHPEWQFPPLPTQDTPRGRLDFRSRSAFRVRRGNPFKYRLEGVLGWRYITVPVWKAPVICPGSLTGRSSMVSSSQEWPGHSGWSFEKRSAWRAEGGQSLNAQEFRGGPSVGGRSAIFPPPRRYRSLQKTWG